MRSWNGKLRGVLVLTVQPFAGAGTSIFLAGGWRLHLSAKLPMHAIRNEGACTKWHKAHRRSLQYMQRRPYLVHESIATSDVAPELHRPT